MELLWYFIIWFVLSCAVWFYVLELKTNNYQKEQEWRLFLFLISTLPATLTLILWVVVRELIDRFQEIRLKKKKFEESKYGVFERKVIVEKYCSHIWREYKVKSSWADRRFRCTKCKNKTQLGVGEFRFLRGIGMVEGEYDREPYIGHIDFLR